MDRLERDLGERVQVLRLSIYSQVGRATAARYGVQAMPTFVIFDREGHPVAQSAGLPDRTQLQILLESLADEVSR